MSILSRGVNSGAMPVGTLDVAAVVAVVDAAVLLGVAVVVNVPLYEIRWVVGPVEWVLDVGYSGMVSAASIVAVTEIRRKGLVGVDIMEVCH